MELTNTHIEKHNVNIINIDIKSNIRENLNNIFKNFPDALEQLKRDIFYDKNPLLLLGEYKIIFSNGKIFVICFTREYQRMQLIDVILIKLNAFFRIDYNFQILLNDNIFYNVLRKNELEVSLY